MKNIFPLVVAVLPLLGWASAPPTDKPSPPPGLYCNMKELGHREQAVRTLLISSNNVVFWEEIDCPVGEPAYPIHGLATFTSNTVSILYPKIRIRVAETTNDIFQVWHYAQIGDRQILFNPNAYTLYTASGVIDAFGSMILLTAQETKTNVPSGKALGLKMKNP